MLRNVLMIAFAFFVLTVSPRAFAHAILLHSMPGDGAVVHSHAVSMVLEYSARIDARRCTLTLTGTGGGQRLPIQMETGGKLSELKAFASNLANGNYLLHWQVLAGDGHITRGKIAFRVAVN